MLTIHTTVLLCALFALARTDNAPPPPPPPSEYVISDGAHDMKFVAIGNHQGVDNSWFVCPNKPIEFYMQGHWKSSSGEQDSSKMAVKDMTFSANGVKEERSATINKDDANTKLGDINGGKIRWTLDAKNAEDSKAWYAKTADVTVHYYITRNYPVSWRLKRSFGGTITTGSEKGGGGQEEERR